MTTTSATKHMLEWSIKFEEGQTYFETPVFIGSELREMWIEDCREHSDEYDREFFALVMTPMIEATIDWDYIARELPKHLNYEKEEREEE